MHARGGLCRGLPCACITLATARFALGRIRVRRSGSRSRRERSSAAVELELGSSCGEGRGALPLAPLTLTTACAWTSILRHARFAYHLRPRPSLTSSAGEEGLAAAAASPLLASPRLPAGCRALQTCGSPCGRPQVIVPSQGPAGGFRYPEPWLMVNQLPGSRSPAPTSSLRRHRPVSGPAPSPLSRR